MRLVENTQRFWRGPGCIHVKRHRKLWGKHCTMLRTLLPKLQIILNWHSVRGITLGLIVGHGGRKQPTVYCRSEGIKTKGLVLHLGVIDMYGVQEVRLTINPKQKDLVLVELARVFPKIQFLEN